MFPTHVFADPTYRALAEEHSAGYAAAEPFPHAVLDDFLPAEACDQILEAFPGGSESDWIRFNDPTGLKLASRGTAHLPEVIYQALTAFNSAPFLQFLEVLTGIEGLIPDPYLEGGGIHQIQRGGFLKVHADFNHHEALKLDRRLNVLLYLNRDWQEEYGGHLELWDREMQGCVQRILPEYNRCVVFSTTDWSYHGHPEALNCPEGMSRKSLALYYYTVGRPDAERSESHSTLYQLRPEEQARHESAGFRLRSGLAKASFWTARWLHKPGNLLQIIGSKLQPPQY